MHRQWPQIQAFLRFLDQEETSSQQKTKKEDRATENISTELDLVQFHSNNDLYFPSDTDHEVKEMTKYTAVHQSETEESK